MFVGVADGTDSNSTNVALGYARVLIGGYSEELIARRAGGQAPERLITPVVRVWFNPDLESRDFMIPGVLASGVALLACFLQSDNWIHAEGQRLLLAVESIGHPPKLAAVRLDQ